MSHRQAPNIAPQLIWRQLDGNVVIVLPWQGDIHVLNPIGTSIWQLLVEQCSIADIERHLVTHYDVSEADARRDLAAFLADLTERELLIGPVL